MPLLLLQILNATQEGGGGDQNIFVGSHIQNIHSQAVIKIKQWRQTAQHEVT